MPKPDGGRRLEELPLVFSVGVRFCDIDGMGHVNNAVFATFFEMGRTEYWRRAMGAREPADMSFILARQEIDFLRPIFLSDRVELGIGLDGIGRSSFGFEYVLVASDRVAARGKSVQVFFDYAKGEKTAVPGGFRERIAAFEAAAGARKP